MRILTEGPELAALQAFETARQAALVSADPEALEALLHPDLQHIHSTGRVHDKAGFIAHVRAMGGFVSITRGALTHALSGDVALITGPTINRVRRPEGLAELKGFGTVLAVRGAQGWQVRLSQITMDKDTA
jgi:hypothetical protein